MSKKVVDEINTTINSIKSHPQYVASLPSTLGAPKAINSKIFPRHTTPVHHHDRKPILHGHNPYILTPDLYTANSHHAIAAKAISRQPHPVSTISNLHAQQARRKQEVDAHKEDRRRRGCVKDGIAGGVGVELQRGGDQSIDRTHHGEGTSTVGLFHRWEKILGCKSSIKTLHHSRH